jgi:hypothetical protein
MRQGPYPIPDKLLNKVAPATHADSAPKGPFVFIILRLPQTAGTLRNNVST